MKYCQSKPAVAILTVPFVAAKTSATLSMLFTKLVKRELI